MGGMMFARWLLALMLAAMASTVWADVYLKDELLILIAMPQQVVRALCMGSLLSDEMRQRGMRRSRRLAG